MRPRGPSSSSPSSRYVGHVAVQKPQCTHARRIASASRPSCVSRMKSASAVLQRAIRKPGIEAAAVQDTRGIEHRLEPAMELVQRCGQRMKGADGLVGRAKERRVPSVVAREGAHRARDRCARRRRASATRRSISIICSPPSSACGALALTDSRHSGAPAARAATKQASRVLANAVPERVAVGQHGSADLPRGGIDRRRGARQAHARAGPRDGRSPRSAAACPLHSFVIRIASLAAHSTTRVASDLGQRHALERDFGQHAERPQRARHEPRQIETRDVLHHRGRRTRGPRRDRRTSARRGRCRASRPRRVGAVPKVRRRTAPPSVAFAAESRRLARQHLARRAQASRTTSASRVPARAVTTSSGRIVVRRCPRRRVTSSTSPAVASP